MVRSGIVFVVCSVWMVLGASAASATCGPMMCSMKVLNESCQPVEARHKRDFLSSTHPVNELLWATPHDQLRLKVSCSYSCQAGPPKPGESPPAVISRPPHSSDLSYRDMTSGESLSLKELPASTCPGDEVLFTLPRPLDPTHEYTMMMYRVSAPRDLYWHDRVFRAASALLVLVTLDF